MTGDVYIILTNLAGMNRERNIIWPRLYSENILYYLGTVYEINQ